MDGKKIKETCIVYTHTLASTTPEKEHQISWKCILLWHLFFLFFFLYILCQHELGFQLQMALEIKYTMLSPFALALDFKSRFYLFLFLLATKALLHGLECPALFSVSVCGCAELKIWRAEKEWTSEENAIDSCRSLSFPYYYYFLLVLLHLSPLFSHQASLSVCLSQFVSPYAPASLLSIPPPYFCPFPCPGM